MVYAYVFLCFMPDTDQRNLYETQSSVPAVLCFGVKLTKTLDFGAFSL